MTLKVIQKRITFCAPMSQWFISDFISDYFSGPGPQVVSGLIVHPFENAKELLKGYREVVSKAPDELTVWAVMRKAPPLPFIPAEWHGREVLIFAALLFRRYGGGRQGDGTASEPRQAHCRRAWASSLRALAGGVRSASHTRSPQLLEDA